MAHDGEITQQATVQDTVRATVTPSYARLCTIYLVTHRRLPGSARTARLRKKRRVRLWAWWNKRRD
jgi:hypothetical protein